MNWKPVTWGATVVAVLALVPVSPLAAQATPPPRAGTLVFSQNKCPPGVVDKVNAAADSVFGPILNELVTEGKLLGWGILEHGWGDEWNWNVWYSVANHRAFLDFWQEYVRRLNQRHPGWFARYGTLCTDHKDNIYSVRR